MGCNDLALSRPDIFQCIYVPCPRGMAVPLSTQESLPVRTYQASSSASRIQLQHPDRTHCRWIGRIEMEDMERRKEVTVSQRGNGRLIARLIPQPEPLRSIHEASKPSITYADVLASVGLQVRVNATNDVSRGRMIAAQQKIAAFGEDHYRCTWYGAPIVDAPVAVAVAVVASVVETVLPAMA